MHRQPDGSPWPRPPLPGYTVADLFTLDLPRRTQLIDAGLVFAPEQCSFHSVALSLLEIGLYRSAPEELRIRRQMLVVLDAHNAPEPDLVVITRDAVCPAGRDQYSAADVVLAVEVVSPDSESRDRSTKPLKYAAAGIPHFWLVEMDPRTKRPVVRTHAYSAATRAYEPTGVHHERLKADEPFRIDIDLGEYDRL
ncbi:Uma2 family endonuclease [Streptomyces tsukubensis]